MRCVYRGWKFRVHGNCVDLPSEPEDSDFRGKLQIEAYPTREWGGVIWAYFGRAVSTCCACRCRSWSGGLVEAAPAPRVEFSRAQLPAGAGGDIDTAHVSYLHSTRKPRPQNQGVVRPVGRIDKAPKLMVLDHETRASPMADGAQCPTQRRLLLARHAVPVADVRVHPGVLLAQDRHVHRAGR